MSDNGSEDFEEEEEGINLGTYEGDRNEAEERHGFGKATLPNGDTYEGYYEHGKRHGKGTYRFKNGAKFVGDYSTGKKHGQGSMWYPDGSRYEGDWVDDQRNGRGDWYQNQRHGQGVYTYSSTGTKYKGTWQDGKRDGSGELIHANHRYIGNFVDDQPSGHGKYRYDIGCEQTGQYILEEKIHEGDAEEDETLTILIPKWKSAQISEIPAVPVQ